MEKEFDPKALNDEWYWKYVYGQRRPEDLVNWLQSHGLTQPEAEKLAFETELAKQEAQVGKERLKEVYGVTRGSFWGET